MVMALRLVALVLLILAQADVDQDVKFVARYGFMSSGDDIMPAADMTIQDAKVACAMRPDCIGFTFMGSSSDTGKHTTWLKSKWDFFGDPDWTSYKRVQDGALHPTPLLDIAGLAKIAKSRPRYHRRHETSRLQEIRGVAYGPVPQLPPDDVAFFPDHFVMGRFWRGQWANDGRNDIGLLKQLGANVVLLRGRGPWHKPWSGLDQSAPQCHFKWFRFVPTKSRGRYGGIRINQFHFKNHNGVVSFNGAKATVMFPWSGHVDQGPHNTIDGNDSTQWWDSWKQAISIEFPNEVEVDSFSFTTANDNPDDDPIRWHLQGSRDGEIWVLLHDQDTDYSTPRARGQQTEWFSWENDDCRQQQRGLFNSTDFLDNANALGMKAIVGLPDHPFFLAHRACAADKKDMNCQRVMKRHYLNKLQTGFTVWKAKRQDYHPAVDTVVLMNKPEVKLHNDVGNGMTKDYMRAIVSAFDGILAAEEALGIDPLIGHARFSVTFDYTPCPTCKSFADLKGVGCCVPCGHRLSPCEAYGEVGSKMACKESQIRDGLDNCPVLAQIMDLHNAMKNPKSVGYTPKMESPSLFEAYQERWIHSFHSNMPFELVQKQVLDKYKTLAKSFNIRRGADKKDKLMPIFIGEFHSTNSYHTSEFARDVRQALDYARDRSNSFIGLNIYTFQVPYGDSTCDEAQWALFESGRLKANPCPERSDGLFSLGDTKAGTEARVPMLTEDYEKRWQSWKVVPIYCLQPAVPGKLEALADIFGGTVPDTSVCEAGIAAKPALHCVANRSAQLETVVTPEAAFACEKLRGKYDCRETPPNCRQHYEYGDWALSIYVAHYAALHPHHRERLCNTNGAGVLTAFPPRPECTADLSSIRPAETSKFGEKPSLSKKESKDVREDTGTAFLGFCLVVLCASLGCFVRLHKRRVQAHWARINAWGDRFTAQQVTRPTAQQPLRTEAEAGPPARASILELADLADWS